MWFLVFPVTGFTVQFDAFMGVFIKYQLHCIVFYVACIQLEIWITVHRFSPLNEDQNKILNFVLTPRVSSWPLVIYGPFGTGKTRTLAEAAMVLTAKNCNAYILICTLTNQ